MRKMKPSGVEWIGDIPQEWEIKKCFQMFDQVKNRNTGMQETNLLSLSYGKIVRKNINTTTGLLPESFDSYNIINSGDIVLRLTDLQNDHTSLRVGLAYEKGIVTSAYLTLRKKCNGTSSFFYYSLHTFDIIKGFYGMGSGIRQGLNWDSLKNLILPLPPISEQQRIAEFLDRKCAEIDSIIAKTKATVEEYKALKQAVITEAVTKGIRPDRPMKDSGVEWIGEIPQEWSKDKVFRVFSTIGSGTTPKSSDESKYEGNINWIQSGDINGGIITEVNNHLSIEAINKYSALRMYALPFIVIAMYGASIGNVSISKIDSCVNQACCVLAEPKININYAFLSIKAAKNYLITKAVGGGQPNISQDIVKSLWLPIPPLPEQKSIADYLDHKCAEIDRLIAAKEQLLTELESYKKSVIYEYVTGKKEI